MTGFRLIAPPQTRRPVGTLVALVMASLAATIMLSNFIDALHLSMARGESLRAAHRMAPPTRADAGEPILVALAPLQRAKR